MAKHLVIFENYPKGKLVDFKNNRVIVLTSEYAQEDINKYIVDELLSIDYRIHSSFPFMCVQDSVAYCKYLTEVPKEV